MRAPAAVVAALLASCGSSAKPVDRHVEDLITITQGVYGQTTAADDVGAPAPRYFIMTLQVFAAPRSDGDTPVAAVTSGDRGFYEVVLPVGDFDICTTFGRCAPLTVRAGTLVRLDYEFSNGPGWREVPPEP